MAGLDLSKPYKLVVGKSERKYYQDGLEYDANKKHIGKSTLEGKKTVKKKGKL